MLRTLTRLSLALLPILALITGMLPASTFAWDKVGPAGEPPAAVTALSVAPGNADVVYAASPTGLYRSADAGATWVVGSRQPGISALAVSPISPDSVYAYFWPSGPSGRPGLWRSDDGGRTWTNPARDLASAPSGQATALALDSADGRTLLLGVTSAGGYGSILRSVDGGATWETTYTVQSPMGPAPLTAIVSRPDRPATVYAAHAVYHGGSILRSDDGGRTWQPLPLPSPPLTFPSALAVSAAEPGVLYAAFQGPVGSGARVFRTTDDGATWTERGADLPVGAGSGVHLIAHPTASGTLALSLIADPQGGIYRSDDAGQSWARDERTNTPALEHVSALAFGANGQWLLAGTPAGVWREAWQPAIAAVFAEQYRSQDGLRLLGAPLASAASVDGRQAQYFEKGRMEDHHGEASDPNWQLMYGLLVDDLHEARASQPVGGDTSTATYADVHSLAGANHRLPPPPDSAGGEWLLADGGAFVPFDAQLAVGNGHTVPRIFWDYINQTDLFPGGWLHDVGLPVTEPFEATVYKGIVRENRVILVQAFQRTILTFDPVNPPEWRVERANVGSDYARAFPGKVK
ncbi:MAG: WD40/YVTN/BNR-like repeat-containing protein [Chloroflexota bacterium]